jgi:hypothetical protein
MRHHCRLSWKQRAVVVALAVPVLPGAALVYNRGTFVLGVIGLGVWFYGVIAGLCIYIARQNRRSVRSVGELVRRVYAGEIAPPDHWDQWWHRRYVILREQLAAPDELTALREIGLRVWEQNGGERFAQLEGERPVIVRQGRRLA